jgi:hypothetical protein
VEGAWRRLHNEELHNLDAKPDISRAIKTRKMRWVGQVARMGKMRNVYRVLVGHLKGGKLWPGFLCPRIGTIGGFL